MAPPLAAAVRWILLLLPILILLTSPVLSFVPLSDAGYAPRFSRLAPTSPASTAFVRSTRSAASPLSPLKAVDVSAVANDIALKILGGPAVLLLPIGVGALLASGIAWFIIGYAEPEAPEEDGEEDMEY